MSNERSPTQYKGVRAIAPPDLTLAKIAPPAGFRPVVKGQLYLNTVAQTAYMWSGASWIALGSGAAGGVVTINSLSPTAGNIDIVGTANQVAVANAVSTVTLSIPAAFIAPGSIVSTTTMASGTTLAAGTSMTAGTTITATLGNITATNGDFVGSAAGTGILLNSAQASGDAASPVVVNGRSGRATFTSVSIAAAADLTLTLTNSAITAATTEVLLSMSGATTGSALSIKSKTASAGSLAIVVTNGTGATTTTADIQIDFLVLNA